jgi:hypothetical protein
MSIQLQFYITLKNIIAVLSKGDKLANIVQPVQFQKPLNYHKS